MYVSPHWLSLPYSWHWLPHLLRQRITAEVPANFPADPTATDGHAGHASAVRDLSEWGYVPANGKKTTRPRGQNVGQKDVMCHFEIMPTVVNFIPIVSSPVCHLLVTPYIYNLLHIDGPQPIHFCHLWGFKDNFLGCHWMPLNSNPHDQSTISNLPKLTCPFQEIKGFRSQRPVSSQKTTVSNLWIITPCW